MKYAHSYFLGHEGERFVFKRKGKPPVEGVLGVVVNKPGYYTINTDSGFGRGVFLFRGAIANTKNFYPVENNKEVMNIE